ncbi:cytochrome c biogenesis protein ResB [Acidobacteriota bacterium]
MTQKTKKPIRVSTSLLICIALALLLNIVEYFTTLLEGSAAYIPAAAFLIPALGLFIVFYRRLKRYLISIKFAVALLIFLCAAIILGTFVIQGVSTDEFVVAYTDYLVEHPRLMRSLVSMGIIEEVTRPEHDRKEQIPIPPKNRLVLEKAYHVLDRLRFTDVFHSYWFMGMTLVLGACLLHCTLTRRPWHLTQAGFLLTHLSLVLIFIGSTYGLIFGIKGIMWITEGDMTDTFVSWPKPAFSNNRTERQVKLPFSVACDDFILEKYEDRFKLYVYIHDHEGGKYRNPYPLDFTGNMKEPLPIRGTPYSVKVLKQYLHFVEKVRYEAVEEDSGTPAALLTLASEDGETQVWMTAEDPQMSLLPLGDSVLKFAWDPPDKILPEQKDPVIMVIYNKQKVSLKAVKGTKSTLGKPPLTVEVTGVYPDFIRMEGKNTTRSQMPNNPAAELRLRGSGKEESLIIFGKPEFKSFGVSRQIPGVEAVLDYPPSPPATVLVGSTSQLGLFDGKSYRMVPLEIGGDPVEVAENWSLRLDALYRHAAPVLQGAEDPHVGNRPAIEITVVSENGPEQSYFLVGDLEEPVFLGKRDVVLLYRKQFKEPKDYKSLLRIVKDGEVVRTKTIEVNHPLKYKGFIFYQSRYEPESAGRRARTGLEVVRDPGLYLVYTGFILMLVGIVFTFYIKPRLAKGADHHVKK